MIDYIQTVLIVILGLVVARNTLFISTQIGLISMLNELEEEEEDNEL